MRAKARFFYFLFFIIFIPIVLVSAAAAVTRIMPLGNSITQGINSGEPFESRQISYRKALWDKLLNAGYDVDFVGSLNSGWALFADPNHEGNPGWTADEIAAEVCGFLVANPADIILLHIGTNGLSTDPGGVEHILDEIDRYETAYGAEITVVLARIINRACCEDDPQCSECTTTTTFNDNVEDMAYSRVYNINNPAYPDNIIFGAEVDMEDGAGIDYLLWPSGDMDDNLHPYQDPTTGEAPGYAKMADVWFSALQKIIPDPDPVPNPPNNSSSSDSGCFISTATYCLNMEPHTKAPVDFRDHLLLTNFMGRAFVDFYHSIRHLWLISTTSL